MKIKTTAFKLFRLIKSLKKEEKRYFKMRIDGQRAKYLTLFNYLDKVEKLDKKNYKQTFAGIKQLSAMQTYLYQQILTSLQQQHMNSSVRLQLQHSIIQVDILYQRDLTEEAKELVNNSLEVAIEKEFFAEADQLFAWWYLIENRHSQYLGISTEDMEITNNVYKKNAAQLMEYSHTLVQFSDMVFQIKDSSHRSHEELWKITWEKALAVSCENFLSYKTKLTFLQWKSSISGMCRDITTAKTGFLKIIQLLEQAPPPLFEIYKGIYIAAILSTIAYLLPSEEKLFCSLNEKIKAIPIGELSTREKTMWRILWHQYLVKNNQLEEAIALAATINIQHFFISEQHKQHFYLDWAIAYFGLKKYDQALALLDAIIEKQSNHLATLLGAACLLKAIIFYEKEAYRFLPYLLKSIQHTMKKTGVLFEFEYLFINFLKKISHLPKLDHKKAFLAFEIIYQNYIKQVDEEGKEFLKLFNYQGWLTYHIDGSPFTQLIL